MAEVACIAWLVPLASAKSDDVGNVLLEFDEVTVHMSTNKILQEGKLVNHPSITRFKYEPLIWWVGQKLSMIGSTSTRNAKTLSL